MEHTIGEKGVKVSFVGNHDTPKRTSTSGGANISKASLSGKSSVGAVGKPAHSGSTLNASGSYKTNEKNLSIPHETTGANKGAKWERPHVQNAHPSAKNQYGQA